MAPAPTPGAPPALSAFLRGTGRRALLFAALQAGEGPAVDAALARAVARFACDAAGLPMGAWPSRFWGALLGGLPRADASVGAPMATMALPGLDALAPPGSGARTALLLALVAGLDEDDGAAALGVDAETWRLALRRAAPRDEAGDFDETAWRALAAALRDAQRDLPEARLAGWEAVAATAFASPPAFVPASAPDAARRRRILAALWIAVGVCALALAATFVPWRAWLTGEGAASPGSTDAVPLAAAAAPDAQYDAAFALRHHPDLPRLLAGEDALLRDLDFGAWYAARRAGAEAATSAPVSAPPAEAAAEGAAEPTAEPAMEPVVEPAGTGSASLPAFDALSPKQRVQLERRVAASDALSRVERGALRERWEAWQRLPETQRDAVRAALGAFAALPAADRQALRNEFAAQPLDLQRAWILGPVLGARWPRLQPLLQQVPAAERDPLLDKLHAMDAAALDALAEVAPRTPPQARDAVRRQLIAAPRR